MFHLQVRTLKQNSTAFAGQEIPKKYHIKVVSLT